MSKANERAAVFVFGVVFVITMIVLAVAFPKPTVWQFQVFRIVLALAAAGVAAMLPGSIEVTASKWLKAGGALAVFVVVLYLSPAKIVADEPEPMGPLEIGQDRYGSDFSPLPQLVGTADICASLCSTNLECKAMTFVKRPDDFGGGDCWLKKEVPEPTPNPAMVSAVKVRWRESGPNGP